MPQTLTVGDTLPWMETVQRRYRPAGPLGFVHGPAPAHGRSWRAMRDAAEVGWMVLPLVVTY